MKKILITVLLAILCSARAYAAEEYFRSELEEISALLAQCEERCIPTSYESLGYSVLERFSEYIKEDEIRKVPDGQLTYNKSYMQELYNTIYQNLNGYLAGEKTPASVKKYNLSEFSGFQAGGRPVFSVGYGHGSQVRQDIGEIGSFGATNIQIETGPTRIFNSYPSYNVIKSTKSGSSAVCEIKKGSDQNKFFRVSNLGSGEYIALTQTIRVKPNTQYRFGCEIMGAGVNGSVTISANATKEEYTISGINGAYAAKERIYTTGADENKIEFRLVVRDSVSLLHIDNIFVKDANENNLLFNGDFEDDHDKREIEELKYILDSAAENNILVTLLLSPHYFPEDLDESVYAAGNNGFIKYNIDIEQTREIVKNYLELVCGELKDRSAISNICITNEPVYMTYNWPEYYTPIFRAWLKDKYKSVENLNSAYNNPPGKEVASFENIEMPRAYVDNGLFYDWIEFNDGIFVDWHKWAAGIIREYFPNKPLDAKVMNLMTAGTDNRGPIMHGADPEKFDAFSDWAGNNASSYESGNGEYTKDSFLNKMLWYDYLSSVTGKPVYNSEDHVLQNFNGDFGGIYAKHISADLWQGMIHHNNMSSVWTWDRNYDPESDRYNSILHRPDCVFEIGNTALDLNRLSGEVKKIADKKPRVAILYSLASRTACNTHCGTINDVYEILLELGQNVGFITESEPLRVHDYDVIIIADAPATTNKMASEVKKFIDAGKYAISVGERNFTKNEHKADAEYSLDGAAVADMSTLRSVLGNILDRCGLMQIKLIDEDTGSLAEGVEWEYYVDGKNVLINVFSYDSNKTVSVHYDGVKLDKLEDLLSGDVFDDGSVRVREMRPMLLRNQLCGKPKEVKILSANNNTVKWIKSDDAYDSANIYGVNANGSLEFIKNTGENTYYADEYDVMVIRAVDSYGNESDGTRVCVGEADLTPVVEGNVAYVTNTESRMRSGVLYVSLEDANGNILKRSQVSFALKPGETARLNICFTAKADETINAGVQKTIYDR